MNLRRIVVVIALAVVVCIQQGSLRAATPPQEFVSLMFCTPWTGCGVAFFYYEEVQVVASSGHLDVDWSGWWGNRGGCELCEFETLEPPEHPEPVDDAGGSACGDERDAMITEYDTFSVNMSPACHDFGSYGDRFVKPEDSHATWGIIKEGILFNKQALIQEYSGLPGDANVTSAYRCPHRNAATPGSASQSRHMYGDALDLKPPPAYPLDQYHYTLYRNAALQTSPGWISEWSTYADRHLHVDWR